MKIQKKMWLMALAMSVLLTVGGCLVSGTFIVTEMIYGIDFTTNTGFYFYDLDITDNSDWEDHKDDIDNIKLAGFEMWITNNSVDANTFNAYIDPSDDPVLTTVGAVQSDATQIIKDLPVAAGNGTQTYISYDQSLTYLINFETLKTLAKEGKFHYYGMDESQNTNAYTIDSIRVILTVEASS